MTTLAPPVTSLWPQSWPMPATTQQRTAAQTQQVVQFRPGPAFDWATGEFVFTAGKTDVALATPQDTWVDWCAKAVIFPRGASRFYSPQYGSDLPYVLGRVRNTQQRAAEINRTVVLALRRTPRTRSASQITTIQRGNVYELTVGQILPAPGRDVTPTKVQVIVGGVS